MMKFLIDDARRIFHRWSVQFALLAGLLLQQLATDPQAALDLAAMIQPEWLRRVAVFALVSGVPILLSVLRQPTRTQNKEPQ